jgi:hypothetical protein
VLRKLDCLKIRLTVMLQMSSQIKMEITELQENYHIKDKYNEGNLTDFENIIPFH